MERALLVTVKLNSQKEEWRLQELALELEELAGSTGVEAIDNITCQIDKPTPNFFIGSGKAEELTGICQEQYIDTVIFSCDLSGTQQRNLEEVIAKKTIDRTQLILDIFARHARSPEGKMQVELAQLEYLLPRLVGKGIILSRLGGGIGTRGPGEQKLEIDRRRIRKRIDKLREDLKAVSLHRQRLRKKRRENAVPAITLVGYTNAGKSTLLNALTNANQIVSDSLFTTLDPLHKGLQLPDGENIVISDTVGFLHHLPHRLIEAFKATLEEVGDSDLLIHVLDASAAQVYAHHQAVLEVLKGLGADNKPIITALNKIDLLDNQPQIERLQKHFSNPVPISAKSGENLQVLLKEIQKNFVSRMVKLELMIPHSRMDLLDLFHRQGKVEQVTYLQKGVKIKLNLPKITSLKLLNDKEIRQIN